MSYHPEPQDELQWRAFLMVIPFALIFLFLASFIGAC